MLACLCVAANGCQTVPAPVAGPALPPVRFLLTFDDGPSAEPDNNTTLRILQNLESNPVQPGTKALFFVQTRNADGGGSEFGQQLLRSKHQSGHVLGLHSGTERGHIRHTLMGARELSQSLRNGTDDLRRITGDQPLLVRPTFWGYNDHTVELYTAHGYRMLLTDVNTRDGFWFHNVVGMRNRIHNALKLSRQAMERGELPTYHGVVPLVVTFHDLNEFTSYGIGSYMQMLADEATAVGLRVASKPFYDAREDILAVATLRAETPETLAHRARQKKQARKIPVPTTTASLATSNTLD